MEVVQSGVVPAEAFIKMGHRLPLFDDSNFQRAYNIPCIVERVIQICGMLFATGIRDGVISMGAESTKDLHRM